MSYLLQQYNITKNLKFYLVPTCKLETPNGGAQLVFGGIQGHGDDDGCWLLVAPCSTRGLLLKGRSSCISRPPPRRVGDPDRGRQRRRARYPTHQRHAHRYDEGVERVRGGGGINWVIR